MTEEIRLGKKCIVYVKDGVIHRDNDLPAIIFADGIKVWMQNGEITQKTVRPSVMYPDGYEEYHISGFKYHHSRPKNSKTIAQKIGFGLGFGIGLVYIYFLYKLIK
jgi:hypothetical protein